MGRVMRKSNHCINCDKLIWRPHQRCRSCSSTGKLNSFYNKNHSKESINKMSNKRDSIMGTKNPNFGKGLFGEDNPNWQNGVAKDNYTRKFKQILSPMIRKKIKKCQKCYKNNDLVVHHIDYDKKNDSIKNLITLCRSCNAKVNFGKKFYSYLFQYKIEKGLIDYG